MHPVLFETFSITVYSYGLMIAVGIAAGMTYLIIQGRKELGLTFDQANSLFLAIFIAAVAGGKLFLFFEEPSFYIDNPGKLLTGRGFVFYGSFLAAVPAMWWLFRKFSLPPYQMLDLMAVTTCFVHMFGRIGCFLAGCCFGKPTDSGFGVTFTDDTSYAEPRHTPLYPTQLMEAGWILLILLLLFRLKRKRLFHGQLFLLYLILYAVGRFVIEYYRGDAGRGFIIEGYVSHSQLIAICVAAAVATLYISWSKRSIITKGATNPIKRK